VVKVDGSGMRHLTGSRYGPDRDSEPAWSPDGKRIAYVSAGGNSPLSIWVMNSEGTRRHRVTVANGGDTSPSWSPDGRRIVFAYAHPISDICVVNADGSGRRRLTGDDSDNRDPDWQPLR
jgi:TolB protein